MSEGLKTLLEAAQYIEQQEKLKLSPHNSAPLPAALLNEESARYLVQAVYEVTTTNGHLSKNNNSITVNANNINNNNNNINNNHIIIRNSNVHHVVGGVSDTASKSVQVSASVPTAFQYVNGHSSTENHVTLMSDNGSTSSHHCSSINQLMNGNHHDCEFKLSGSAPLRLSPLSGVSTEDSGCITANHQLKFANGNSGAGTGTNMLVGDASPSPASYLCGTNTVSRQHSPPRSAAGSHYMQLMNSAAVQQIGCGGTISGGSGHVAHIPSRRRTISSNSNGAGTREVHNKLEKNRRAHLKECYEALKNQLSLKDEDRRKTSNLAILGEALKCVQSFQKRSHELETEWEHLANDKINLQKRIISLKRELGYKYEQLFSGIFPDVDSTCIPSERESLNDTVSLSSGRGSTLYSSSSSLSNGGSNGSISSNTLSSPVSAGLQTATTTTAISPVINKSDGKDYDSAKNASPTSATKILQSHHHKNTLSGAVQTAQIPNGTSTYRHSSTGSPTALIKFSSNSSSSNNNSPVPLSLTAKNISATSMTRGSPTPSTPSPSPSSSSGVSSSSSLISSSPPINGVISTCTRNLSVNIPNGLKFQTTGSSSSISSSAAAPTVRVCKASGVNLIGQQNGRKKNLGISGGAKDTNSINYSLNPQTINEDGEQPAKFLKVYNTISSPLHELNGHKNVPKTKFSTSVGVGGQLQNLVLSGSAGGGARTTNATAINGGVVNEFCRLPGGAELNILPTNGLKTTTMATAFYHSNGKLTFVNPPPSSTQHQVSNSVLLKEGTSVTPLLVTAATTPNATNSANGKHFSGNFTQLLGSANGAKISQTTNNTIVTIPSSSSSSSLGLSPTSSSASKSISQNNNTANGCLNKINGKTTVAWLTSGTNTTSSTTTTN